MTRYSEKYFEHVENCQCNIDKIKKTMNAAVARRSPWEVDKDGQALFYCDSFGFRGKIPGETEDCYRAMSDARSKAQEKNKVPDECTCWYSSNGVWDGLEDDCPLTEDMHPGAWP